MPMTLVILGIIVVLTVLLFASGYVKASPDTAYIISGLKKEPKVLIGKAGIKIPFLEKKDELNLQIIPIDVKTSSSVPTADYINIMVDAVVNVKISDDAELLKVAAQNFLNQNTDYISHIAQQLLEGNIREIVGQMRLEQMVSDRQAFAEKVKENAEPDLRAMGLALVSFNVQNFLDENGVIENLGVDNIVKIQKSAAISRAVSEKEIAVAQANAAKESNDAQIQAALAIENAKANAEKEKAIIRANAQQAAKEAEIEANTQIAQKENELAIKKAELQKDADTKQAIADASYQIQQETERKTIEIATAEANLARQEKAILLKQKEVELTERALEAEIKKKADAEKYAAQQKADTELYATQKASEAELFERMKKAEAEKFEAEQQAAAQKALADAIKAQGIAEAEAAKAKGEAEAAAIQAKAEAEAEGLLKKAEAMKQYEDAAKMDMQIEALKLYFEQLPEIARAVGEGYKGVDKIVMLGNDSSQLAGNIMSTTTQISEGLNESLGIDLKSLLAGFIGGKLADNSSEATK